MKKTCLKHKSLYNDKMIHAMIMAGGRGTRFWPLSTRSKPKQFLSIIEEHTLLESTLRRLDPLIAPDKTWILGSQDHEQWLKPFATIIPPDQLLLEPIGRNTAATIVWAALELVKKDPDAIMVVLPADHYISPKPLFHDALSKAVQLAQHEDVLVTIGISPDKPHTGYGYIELGKEIATDVYDITAFHEKPSLEVAKTYISSGQFLWNSGMFVWKATVILEVFQRFLPEHWRLLTALQCVEKNQTGAGDFAELFSQFPAVSIDYGIMEKATDCTRVITSHFEWSDIGSWAALESFWKKDANNNARYGNLIQIDSFNNLIYSPSRTVTLVDVHDMIVVDSGDVIMIAKKSSDQRIKDLMTHLPEELL